MKNSAKKKNSVVLYQLFILHDYTIINVITVKKHNFFWEKFTQLLHFFHIILEHCMALPWPFQWLV